jgi:hypothetical protein
MAIGQQSAIKGSKTTTAMAATMTATTTMVTKAEHEYGINDDAEAATNDTLDNGKDSDGEETSTMLSFLVARGGIFPYQSHYVLVSFHLIFTAAQQRDILYRLYSSALSHCTHALKGEAMKESQELLNFPVTIKSPACSIKASLPYFMPGILP